MTNEVTKQNTRTSELMQTVGETTVKKLQRVCCVTEETVLELLS
jgi:hypothetical protein